MGFFQDPIGEISHTAKKVGNSLDSAGSSVANALGVKSYYNQVGTSLHSIYSGYLKKGPLGGSMNAIRSTLNLAAGILLGPNKPKAPETYDAGLPPGLDPAAQSKISQAQALERSIGGRGSTLLGGEDDSSDTLIARKKLLGM